MEAIRNITELDDDILSLKLPESFKAKRVEVIVMLAAENDMPEQPKTPRRSPSRKLEGTRIIGDIMTPVVSENCWDALQALDIVLARKQQSDICMRRQLLETVDEVRSVYQAAHP